MQLAVIMFAVAVTKWSQVGNPKINIEQPKHNNKKHCIGYTAEAYNTPFKWISIPDCLQVVNTVAPITSPSGPDIGDPGDGEALDLAAASFLKIYNRVR